MSHIEQIAESKAEGLLKKIYEQAVQRAGKVFNILKIQSLNPETLQAGMGFYLAAMRAASPLSRADRELLATVVSRVNRCFY